MHTRNVVLSIDNIENFYITTYNNIPPIFDGDRASAEQTFSLLLSIAVGISNSSVAFSLFVHEDSKALSASTGL